MHSRSLNIPMNSTPLMIRTPDRDTVARLFASGEEFDEAVREAAASAARLHKQLGIPLVSWRDGAVYLIHLTRSSSLVSTDPTVPARSISARSLRGSCARSSLGATLAQRRKPTFAPLSGV